MEGRVDFDDNEIVSVVSQQCVNISVYKIMLIASLDNLHMSWGSNIYYIYLIKILPRAYIEVVCTLVRRVSGSIGSETNRPFTSK